MLAVKAKTYGVLYKQSSSIAFDETSSLLPDPIEFRVYCCYFWNKILFKLNI